MVTILIPTQMRRLTGGEAQVSARGKNLRQVFRDVGTRYPDLRDRVVEDDRIAPGVSLAIDGNVVSTGLLESVPDEAEITIVPQISGGGG